MKKNNLPVMILAGGFGTRLREETEFMPKPMVPIGNKPILWHIMKLYSHYGFYRFIICLGYKGHMIKDYFLNYRLQGIDFTVKTKFGKIIEHQTNCEEWEVTLVDTGFDCYTGGRIARASKYIDTKSFLLTYGDGVSNVDILKLLEFHKSHGKLATLTGVNMPPRFGNLEVKDNSVVSFMEKRKITEEWINGGFFVLEKDFLNYLSIDSSCVLEKDPLFNASKDGQLMIYKHHGFWQCMDTLRERNMLEEMWKSSPPWKVWEDEKAEYRNIKKVFSPDKQAVI
ncbi:glucose-1-phosphate cytidylyltransferase [Candidatus Babeliales bacterium]|nr:glucose-1-phosphate cytidylyltransferase [Candidatus Babeliales bacterium]